MKSKGVIFAAIVVTFIQLLWFYILTDVVKKGSHRSVDKLYNKTFYVNRFQHVNDFLQLSGQFDHNGYNASFQGSDTLLNIKVIEGVLQNMRPSLSEVKGLNEITMPFKNFLKVNRAVQDINCKKLFEGDKNETIKAMGLLEKQPAHMSTSEYINMTKDCTNFKTVRGYILHPLTKEEQDFPIAYSILMFKDVWQSERLLRAVYRPQNLYCIHVDQKSNRELFKAVQSIAQCFDNVFISSKRTNVVWGNMSVLEPEIYCMQDLWKKSTAWKYFINLAGQEFPLRTNHELVQILRAYNGSNDIEGTIKRANRDRWAIGVPPPHGIIPVKGNSHVAVCRGFVDFALHDPKARDLLEWARKTRHPDETFFATLNHNPSLNVPGSYKGVPETNPDTKPFVARFIKWSDLPCKGKRVRSVCIFGVEDLPSIAPRKELFINKFYWDYQHFALDCMEELNFNNTRDEYLGKLEFNASWYSKLGFVLNKRN